MTRGLKARRERRYQDPGYRATRVLGLLAQDGARNHGPKVIGIDVGATGWTVRFMSADQPDRLRGYALSMMVVDF